MPVPLRTIGRDAASVDWCVGLLRSFGRGGGGSRLVDGILRAYSRLWICCRRPLPLCLPRFDLPPGLEGCFAGPVRQTPPWLAVAVVGAHTAQPLAALPLTDAAYPLRVLCARSIDAHCTGEGRAHDVRPYTCFHEPCPMT